MKLSKTILPILICLSLVLTSFGTAFAEETPQTLQTDESGTYLIGTADQLFAFAELAKTTAETDNANARTVLSAKLTANIDLNPGVTFAYDHSTGYVTISKGGKSCKMGTGMKNTELGATNGNIEELGLRKWTPIGTKKLPYIGYFDGNGYTIDGLYINDDTVYYTGLFGVTGNFNTISGTYDYGEVKNVTIGEHSLIVGHMAYTSGATGAIVGMTNFDKIINCTNYATVVGKGSDSLALAESGLVGGIVGYANNDVKNCTNHGTVVSCESAGGIVGNIMGNQYHQGNIIYCSNYGKVYAEAYSQQYKGYAGGIAVNSGDYENRSAGYGGTVEACVNHGYVEGYYVGGVIYRGSHDTQVKYCANRGEVMGTLFASGIITYINNGSFTMEGCYNAGTVKALPYEGNVTDPKRIFPLVASIYNNYSHTIENCYNDETVCPSGNTLFRDGVTASNSYGVTTEFFATGEPAYKMGSYDNKGWKQNIPTPAEKGKKPETYPTTDGTRRVYKVVHYCCHTDEATRNEHKQDFYSNAPDNITDEHTKDENGVCSHCKIKEGASLEITNDSRLENGTVGKDYFIFLHSNATGTNWTLKAGSELPPGLQLSGDMIQGTPTKAGEYSFTIVAASNGQTAAKELSILVLDSEDGKQNTLSFDGKLLTATVDKEGKYTVIFAGYENDVRLMGMTTSLLYFKPGENPIDIPKDAYAIGANKVYLWRDLGTICPVCMPIEIKLP